MNKEETRRILSGIRSAYPHSFDRCDEQTLETMLNLWADAFKNVPYTIVGKAVKDIIYNEARQFAPSIGEVMSKIRKSITGDENEEAEEAWRIVLKFIRNTSFYDMKEQHELLPERIKKIYSAYELEQLALSSPTENEQYVKPRFLATYKALKNSDEIRAIESNGVMSIQTESISYNAPQIEWHAVDWKDEED